MALTTCLLPGEAQGITAAGDGLPTAEQDTNRMTIPFHGLGPNQPTWGGKSV